MTIITPQDADLIARVLEQDIEAMVNGERTLPAPNGVERLEGIVISLRRAIQAAPIGAFLWPSMIPEIVPEIGADTLERLDHNAADFE